MTGDMNHRKGTDWSRMRESIVYVMIWLVIFLLPALFELVDSANGRAFQWGNIFRWWLGILPFTVLFLINNLYLIPRFLSVHRYRTYVILISVTILIFGIYQYIAYDLKEESFAPREMLVPPRQHPPERTGQGAGMLPQGPPPMKPLQGFGNINAIHYLIPVPVLLNVFLGIMMLGFHLGIYLFLKTYKDQEARTELESMRLQEELKYLKAQINPHFFMNMLNNIHAAVDVDPAKAQEMIIELSKLMRYVLYEGNNASTTFSNEVRFISSYISLMRRRYPADKVEIYFTAPESPADHLKLPPLLFISFVENAFKHGISYMKTSVITIDIDESDGLICFRCCNTKAKNDGGLIHNGGVGLENVKRRLDLLYGSRYELSIDDTDEQYTVKLKLPCL